SFLPAIGLLTAFLPNLEPHLALGTGVPSPGESDKIRGVMKPIARYMEDAGMGIADLVTASGLDRKLVEAIVKGNFTARPVQRQRLAEALGVPSAEISWDHAVEVQHMRGNGPQIGRST